MTTNLAIGSEFAGHRIEALAGRGGMGVDLPRHPSAAWAAPWP